jgi:hypothetical protein
MPVIYEEKVLYEEKGPYIYVPEIITPEIRTPEITPEMWRDSIEKKTEGDSIEEKTWRDIRVIQRRMDAKIRKFKSGIVSGVVKDISYNIEEESENYNECMVKKQYVSDHQNIFPEGISLKWNLGTLWSEEIPEGLRFKKCSVDIELDI